MISHPNKTKVFVLSTSISVHYGPYLERALGDTSYYFRKTGEEKELIGYPELQIQNAKNTEKAKQYLKLMQGSLQTDILLLGMGLHDIRVDSKTDSPQIPIDIYEKNLEEILSLSKKLAKQVFWVTVTAFDEERHNNSPDIQFKRFEKDSEAYHNIALEVMKRNNIPVIDLRTFTKNITGDIFIDHCHFTDDVREKQGVFIANEIKNLRESLGI